MTVQSAENLMTGVALHVVAACENSLPAACRPGAPSLRRKSSKSVRTAYARCKSTNAAEITLAPQRFIDALGLSEVDMIAAATDRILSKYGYRFEQSMESAAFAQAA